VLNAIKDTPPKLLHGKAKNAYLNRLRREDIKTISNELARAKKEAKEAGGEVDFDTISAQMKHKNGGISNAQSTIGMIVGYCPPTRMERRTFHDACEECYFLDDLVKVGANDV